MHYCWDGEDVVMLYSPPVAGEGGDYKMVGWLEKGGVARPFTLAIKFGHQRVVSRQNLRGFIEIVDLEHVLRWFAREFTIPRRLRGLACARKLKACSPI